MVSTQSTWESIPVTFPNMRWLLPNCVLLALSFAHQNHSTTTLAPSILKAPYVVFLFFTTENSNAGAVCSGSIIDHTWIITAKHCVGGDYVDIHYGSNKAFGGYVHKVTKDNYIKHKSHDIALIRTPHIDFNDRINKVALPKFNDHNHFDNWWATTCGWGGMADGKLAGWLQCFDLHIMSNDECTKIWNISEWLLCVKTSQGKSKCGGDSGAPLVTHDNPMLVGITAFGDAGGCTTDTPAGFTRITFHLVWIRNQTGVAYY